MKDEEARSTRELGEGDFCTPPSCSTCSVLFEEEVAGHPHHCSSPGTFTPARGERRKSCPALPSDAELPKPAGLPPAVLGAEHHFGAMVPLVARGRSP